MSTTQTSFYVTGGTLQSNAASYVRRRADEELYDGLSRGNICYVLTSRQMGKSSLMVRTAARLRAEGVTVAVIDLTAIGQNLTAEQWYDGLLSRVGRQLDLEDELEDFWDEHGRVGPLQRWMMAVREVVLKHRPGRVVFFVDEIDVVRTLPFPTDEFFAGIREFYNRRTEDPELERLTFCLLGVATPSDLIRDVRTTPFNVGQRVELTDFTEQEAAPLADGIGRAGRAGRELLQRILYWTGGHPYLTQRLCQAVAAEEAVTGAGGVDRLCEEMFLSSRARERDDNLLFVRERMLRSEVDRAGLLDLYMKARSQKSVKDDETNALVSVLRLSGITRAVEGYLLVRNRIYYRVFDREWIISNMPDAELRRQRAAYRRGVLRAASVAAVVLALVGVLAAWALAQKRSADEQRARAERALSTANEERQNAVRMRALAEKEGAEAEEQREEAEGQRKEAEEQRKLAVEQKGVAEQQRAEAERQRRQAVESAAAREQALKKQAEAEKKKLAAEIEGMSTKRLLYAARMNQAQTAWEDANVGRVRQLLDKYERPASADEEALRGFEWDYLRRLANSDLAGERAHVPQEGEAYLTSFSRDRRRAVIATKDDQGIVRRAWWAVWDLGGGRARQVAMLGALYDGPATAVALSPDGGLVASGHGDDSVRLWDAATGTQIKGPSGEPERIERVAYRRGLFYSHGVTALGFSPDAKVVASGDTHYSSGRLYGTLTLRDTASQSEIASARNLGGGISALAFSPDGRTLVTGHGDGKVMLWQVPPRAATDVPFKPAAVLEGHEKSVSFIAFSANGRAFATGSEDRSVKFWNLASRRRVGFTLTGHQDKITFIAFSPDGSRLATGSADKTIKVWPVSSRAAMNETDPAEEAGQVGALGDAAPSWRVEVAALGDLFDPRALLGSAQSHPFDLTVTDESQPLVTLKGHDGPVLSVAFTADGRTLSSFGGDNTVRAWPADAEPEWTNVGRFEQSVFGVAFSPDGRLLAAGSTVRDGGDEKNVRVWDAATGRERFAFRMSSVNLVAFSRDGKRLAAVGAGADLRVWDTETGREVSTPGLHTGLTERRLAVDIYSISFSPDGRYMVAGDAAGTVTVWNAATLEKLHTLTKAHARGVEAVPFSPGGQVLATASHDGTVRLWDTTTWQPLGPPVEAVKVEGGMHGTGVKAAAFSPDGRFLVTGGTDRVAKVWTLADLQRPPALLEGHSGPITFVSFSPDGRRLATASGDQTVRLWDPASGQEVAVLKGHTDDVWAAVFSPQGGDTIATGGADGVVKLWRSRPRR